VTVASAAVPRRARQHLVWAALLLSLALNLCFVAGALWARFQGPALPMSPEQRLQQIEPRLALDAQQKLAFDQYAETVRSRIRLMHEAIEPLVGNAWSELAKPDADNTRSGISAAIFGTNSQWLPSRSSRNCRPSSGRNLSNWHVSGPG
jgi:hypothetical protein